MISSDQNGRANPLVPTHETAPSVVRTVVPPGKQYGEYRKYLRSDFLHSCAYCTMTEAEAQAIRFVIDHYEPRKARRDLEHEYTNLMYSCDECNMRKGDRYPPPEARADGHRFFRPDQDIHHNHFEKSGIRLKQKSNIGNYSIEALDLNRWALRRIRDIRERLTKCDSFVVEGVLALRKFHIDQLPPSVKGSAAHTIRQAISMANQIAQDIDSLLRDYAKSELIDPDPDAESRTQERIAKLNQLQAIYPGSWRASRKKRR